MFQRIALAVTCSAVFLAVQSPALAGSHLWKINEVFSSPDGSIQFIELKCPLGANNETGLANKSVVCQVSGNSFTFPENLDPNSTSDKHMLLATAGFAALPGAPLPDYQIPANFFDHINGDSIKWHIYNNSIMTFGPGDLPMDGFTTINDNGAGATNWVLAANSPTNFNNQSGQVELPCNGDLNDDGVVNAADLALLLGAWGPCAGCISDINEDGTVNAADLALLLGAWGAC